MRSGLGNGWKSWDTAGIGQLLRRLFVELTEALTFGLGHPTGLGVLL